MIVQIGLITGISLGVEFVTPGPEEEIGFMMVVDLLIFRIIFQRPLHDGLGSK